MEITESSYLPRFSLPEGTQIYKALHVRLSGGRDGFERSYLFYSAHALLVTAVIAIALYLLLHTVNEIAFCGLTVVLGLALCQLGGYMHDTAHMMVLKTKTMNDLVGTVCASALCMNYNAWRLKHAAHHAHPNQEGYDPDIDIPLFSFTRSRYESKTGLARLFRRHQAYLYFPLTLLLCYSFQFKNNVRYFARRLKSGIHAAIIGEIALYIGGFAVWYVVPFILFDVRRALSTVIVLPLTAGFYIASVFAPNHKGMPIIAGNVRISFLEQQIITSRNIASNWFTDFLYLGLNYQIEHHLFPDCPRDKLKRLTPQIRELCRAYGLPFTVIPLRNSFGAIFEGLKEVVREAEGDDLNVAGYAK